jgi:hypothetical protein
LWQPDNTLYFAMNEGRWHALTDGNWQAFTAVYGFMLDDEDASIFNARYYGASQLQSA